MNYSELLQLSKGWCTADLNTTYHEMAEHYNVAIIPARVWKPKDKPNVEGSVGNISTWITAALRNEEFFSLSELNAAIRKKLNAYIARKLHLTPLSPWQELSIFYGNRTYVSGLPEVSGMER